MTPQSGPKTAPAVSESGMPGTNTQCSRRVAQTEPNHPHRATSLDPGSERRDTTLDRNESAKDEERDNDETDD